jgi:hypothetical protein
MKDAQICALTVFSTGLTGTHCNALKAMIAQLRRHASLHKDEVQRSTPGATGRPTGQGRGDCTVLPLPVGMRTFGVQGCNALAVGVSGAAARP